MVLVNSLRLFIKLSKSIRIEGSNLKPRWNLRVCQNIRLYSTDTNKSKTEIEKQRIYYGSLTTQIRSVKCFSLTTSVIGIVAQPIIYKELSSLQSLPLVITCCTFVGFFTFVTPFLLHFITKRYVSYLDYKPKTDSYVAATVNFFCMLKEIEFTTADVKVPEVPGMFTTLEAKGKPLFFDPRLFSDHNHYAKLMGYDKPIDFKLYETSDENK